MIGNKISWGTADQKQTEWAIAEEKLAPGGVLRPNGSKFRRKDKDSGVTHSFMVIGNKIFALAGQGIYLGKTVLNRIKIAEDESGSVYALKISRSDLDDESQVAVNLGISYPVSNRITQSPLSSTYGQSRSSKKYYLPYVYLGISLKEFLEANHSVEQNEVCTLFMLSIDEFKTLLNNIRLNKREAISNYRNCYIWHGEGLYYMSYLDDIKPIITLYSGLKRLDNDDERSVFLKRIQPITDQLVKVDQKNPASINIPKNELQALLMVTPIWKNLCKSEPKRPEDQLRQELLESYRGSYLTNDQCYDLGIQSALVLHWMHTGKFSNNNSGYTHGDLTLGNIVRDDNGKLHLIDFGCSTSLDKNFQRDIKRLLCNLFFDFENERITTIFHEKMLANNERLHSLLKLGSLNLNNTANISQIPTALTVAYRLTLIRFKLDELPAYLETISDMDTEKQIENLNKSAPAIQATYLLFNELETMVASMDVEETGLLQSQIAQFKQSYQHLLIADAQGEQASIKKCSTQFYNTFQSVDIQSAMGGEEYIKLRSILDSIIRQAPAWVEENQYSRSNSPTFFSTSVKAASPELFPQVKGSIK